MILDTQIVRCPYCDEAIELALEQVDGTQQYYEDCHVCCQPIFVQVNVEISSEKIELICTKADEI